MINLNRVCSLSDFEDMADLIEAIAPGEGKRRKGWELAQQVRALAGLPEGGRVLGVGVGAEKSIFHLTNRFEVHATDRYADPGIWAGWCPPTMLTDPGRHAPGGRPWQPERLIVQHMDMRRLRYADGSFDGVFSSSAIEHVGGLEGAMAAMREMARVLRPGGVLTLTTEFKIEGEGDGWEGVYLFDAGSLQALIGASGLEPVDEPVLTIDGDTLSTAMPLVEAVRCHEAGQPLPEPHVVLTHAGCTFTSISLALVHARRGTRVRKGK